MGFSVRIANKAYRWRAARPAWRGDQAPAASSNSGAAEVSSVARRDEHELSCGRCTSSAPHRLPTCRLKTWRESGHCAENSIFKWRNRIGNSARRRRHRPYIVRVMGGPSSRLDVCFGPPGLLRDANERQFPQFRPVGHHRPGPDRPVQPFPEHRPAVGGRRHRLFAIHQRSRPGARAQRRHRRPADRRHLQ